MKKQIVFPSDDSFVENLILQRTGDFVKYGGKHALERWFADGDRSLLVEALRSTGSINRFLRDTADRLQVEAQEVAALVPALSPATVVSIGPGNGLVELFLFDYLPISKLLLIDIEDSEAHAHGYAECGSGYASLAATRNFLVANGVPEQCIQTCNPKHEAIPQVKFDLLISLLSMGFHYPCDDYTDFIVSNINSDGIIVMDKRRRVLDFGYATLLENFRIVNQRESAKSQRVVLATRSADGNSNAA